MPDTSTAPAPRKLGRPRGPRPGAPPRRTRTVSVRLHPHEHAPLVQYAEEALWGVGPAARCAVLAGIGEGVRALETTWGPKHERRAIIVGITLSDDEHAIIADAATRDGHATIGGYIRAMLAQVLAS